MRANLFVYWSMEDTRLRKFRREPKEALLELIPSTYTVYRAFHH